MAVGLALVWSAVAAGQQPPPPIQGVTGTIALEGTIVKTDKGINTVVVKTKDGVDHLFHLTERSAVHGGKAGGEDALRGLDEGSSVVVHYTAQGENKTVHEVDRVGGDGLRSIEGVITKVDRRAKTMAIRLADGSEQTFQLTERAAADVGKDIDGAAVGAARVVVYVKDGAGRPIAHYFKRVS